MLSTLFTATTFVAAIGSVGAQTGSSPNGKDEPKPAAKTAATGGKVAVPSAKTAVPAVKAAAPVAKTPPQGKVIPAPVVAAPAAKPGETKAGAVPKSKTTRAKASKTSSTPRQGLQRLVPPPPPSIPLATLSPSGGTGNIPPNLQYLKKDELVQLSVKLKEQCTKAKQRFDDHEKRVKAQQDKIVLYEKLLSEGVVSRRDLENAKNELDDLESRTSDLEEQVLQLTGDLAVMRKYLPAQKPQ